MLWIKAWHVIFMVTWFAGLFYLPRLFVYHASASDGPGVERFRVMERRLFAITTLGALLVLLIAYHVWCWRLVRDFAASRNVHSHVWYRWFNEVPTLLLIGIVLLAVAPPS
jgi:putative membrane protein